MSAQTFQLDPSIAGLSPELLRKKYDELTSEERRALGLVRNATDQEAAQVQPQPQGAPANFGGMVLPNPNGVKVSEDTDSGGEPTRLPNGVTFQQQNFTGATPSDVSNPPRAALATTVGDWFTDNAPKPAAAAPAQGGDWFEQNAPKRTPPVEPGWLDKQIPLDSYTHATEQGVQSVVRGMRDAVTGLYNTVRHPVDAAKGIASIPAQVAQVPGAVQDINQSADPLGTYAKVGQETAGQGAGQALLALGTEGLAKGAPAAINAAKTVLPGAIEKAATAVRALDPDVVGIVSPRAANSLKVAQRAAKVAGKYASKAADSAKQAAIGPSEAEDFEGITSPQTEQAASLEPEQTPASILAKPPGEALNAPAMPSTEKIAASSNNPAVAAAHNDAFSQARVELGADANLSSIMKRADEIQRGVKTAKPDLFEQFGGEVPPESQGFDFRPAEDIGHKTRGQVEEKMGPIPRGASLKTPPAEALGQSLNDALGGKPLVPGVSLRNQPAAQAVAAGKLPQGFTPVESSVLKGYKYDPVAKEFTAITKNGQSYTHGEVTPDQVKAFEDADSQGQAWTKQIRSNNPLVAKNGRPVTPATMGSESGAVIPKSQAGMEVMPAEALKKPPVGVTADELLEQLKESVRRAKEKK